ncbi:MAG: hypothetical protein LBV67_05705 [Streptococcaceae bacterium]|jgi:hypothetical protein|nr:hypothetical protein [Streptococcaceae bacterium]
MKKFRHIKLLPQTQQFADYGQTQYYIMPFDPSLKPGDQILFSEYDNTGVFLNSQLCDIFQIDLCDGENMILLMNSQNEARNVLEKLKELEQTADRTRKSRFIREKRQATFY